MASNQELAFTCCETVNKLLTPSKFQFPQQENECNNINNIDNLPALLGVQKRWSPVPRTHTLSESKPGTIKRPRAFSSCKKKQQ